MKRMIIPLLLATLGFGCGSDVPTGTDIPVPDLAVAGNSGCATVRFNVAMTFVGNRVYTGPVTGDLVGTVTQTFVGANTFAGANVKNGGTAEWDITAGVLGAFTFETTFENMNFLTDRPGSPFDMFESIGKHRATGGVQKANLTYIGTFPLATLTTDHDYNGVICP